MSLNDLIDTVKYQLSTNTKRNVAKGVLRDLSQASVRRFSKFTAKEGVNIYEHEWDICLILDACRPDLLKEVADQYAYLPDDIETTHSVAPNSDYWMERTFVTDEFEKERQNTVYISGNTFSDMVPIEEHLGEVDHMWKYATDQSSGTIPPQPISDSVISRYRNNPQQKIVAHYMQPHNPFAGSDIEFDVDESAQPIWKHLQYNNVTESSVWEGYKQNLRWVLDRIKQTVMRSVNADILITADHGNAFGKYGIYGHPQGVEIDAIRDVPKVFAYAEDTEEYQPSDWARQQNTTVDEMLENLGYK